MEITVVVGKVTVLDSNDVPQAIVWGVPLSVKPSISESKAFGAPVRLVVIDVIDAATPVMLTTS